MTDQSNIGTSVTGTEQHIWLWIPRCVASGVGPTGNCLSYSDLMVYLHLIVLADLGTRECTVHAGPAAARCGISERSVPRSIGRLADAGLVEVISPAGKNRPWRLRVATGTGDDRYEIPAALVWAARDGGPRLGAETALAVRALLALLPALPWAGRDRRAHGRVSFRAAAERAGMNRSDHRQGLAVILGSPVASGRQSPRTSERGWLQVEPCWRPGPDGGSWQASSLVTLDWSRLSGWPAAHWVIAPTEIRASQEDGPGDVVSPFPDPDPDPAPGARPSKPPAASGLVEKVLASRAQADAILRPLTAAGGRLPSEVWTAVVTANLVHHPSADHRFALEAAKLLAGPYAPKLTQARAAGWDPLALAAALTGGATSSARSHRSVLAHRVGEALTGPANRTEPNGCASHLWLPAPTRNRARPARAVDDPAKTHNGPIAIRTMTLEEAAAQATATKEGVSA